MRGDRVGAHHIGGATRVEWEAVDRLFARALGFVDAVNASLATLGAGCLKRAAVLEQPARLAGMPAGYGQDIKGDSTAQTHLARLRVTLRAGAWTSDDQTQGRSSREQSPQTSFFSSHLTLRRRQVTQPT